MKCPRQRKLDRIHKATTQEQKCSMKCMLNTFYNEHSAFARTSWGTLNIVHKQYLLERLRSGRDLFDIELPSSFKRCDIHNPTREDEIPIRESLRYF